MTAHTLLRRIASLALVLTAAACSGAVAKTAAPAAKPATAASATAVPAAPARPAFNHKTHLGRGPACADCHPDAEKKDRAGMPTAETCLECHEEMEEEAPPEKKIASFVDPKTKQPMWSYVTKQADEIRFSHAPHVTKKVACTECHAGIEQNERIVPVPPMSMDECMACHASKKASTDCAACHERIGLEHAPPNHDRLWAARHGQVFRRGAPESRTEDCALCHEESTCVGCHRDEKPKDHTEHWRVGPGHGLAASLDRDRCGPCHKTDQCASCHTTNAPRSHRGAWGAPRSRHCLNCHEGALSEADGGCGTCHRGTPSHRLAPAKPEDHRADAQCLLCHDRLRHPVNEQNCNECHR